MKTFEQVKAETGLPVTTDLHESSQAQAIGQVVDLSRFPPFSHVRPTCWKQPRQPAGPSM